MTTEAYIEGMKVEIYTEPDRELVSGENNDVVVVINTPAGRFSFELEVSTEVIGMGKFPEKVAETALAKYKNHLNGQEKSV